MSSLLRSLTDEQAHLIGFSDGGEVALLMAGLYPDLPRSVLAWGAAGFLRDPDGEARAAFHNVVDRPSPSMEEYSKQLIAAYGEENAREMTQSFARAVTAIIEAGGDVSRSKAGQITCPVLLIVGEHDPFNPTALVDDYAKAVKNGEAIELSGAGHDLHNSHPEWFRKRVVDWLSTH